MKRALSIRAELVRIRTIEELSEAFEGIASLHISNIRNRVISSKEFFAELWPTYRALRIDPEKGKSRPRRPKGPRAFVAVTAEGKLGGEADERVISAMLSANSQPSKTDIIVIGNRGASYLNQRGVMPARQFPLPPGDLAINAGDIAGALRNYGQVSVFYQTYESLRVQRVVRIELLSAVRELGEDVEEGETVSSQDYIFEPSIEEIASYMESVMMSIALIQIIMESKLAQYANRFNAMNRAKHRASDLVNDYRRLYYRAKRAESDERLKEMIKVMRVMKNGVQR